jgi:hypothetical protein
LTEHLAALRSDTSPPPLSEAIRRSHYQPSETLREHLLGLTASRAAFDAPLPDASRPDAASPAAF